MIADRLPASRAARPAVATHRYRRRAALLRRIAARLLILAGLGGPALAAAPDQSLGRFSAMPLGEAFGDGWRVTTLPDVKPTRFAVVEQGDDRVLRADAQGAAASLTRAVSWEVSEQQRLEWRWRVERVVAQGDVRSRPGDDFAARLYVMFDYPEHRLSLLARAKLTLARWLHGDQVPTAALCYVWGNREPVGTRVWNAYTDRVRMIVLRNADGAVGQWVVERRDLAADYREAFGEPPAAVTGLAIAADTDQTGEAVTAWFGDIRRVDR